MPKKISDRVTPVTPSQFLEALYRAWLDLFEEVPKHESLLVLMAHSALETGRWKYLHNYNFGNVKGVDGDGRDYCYYACNEVLDIAVAAAYEAKSTPDRSCRITSKIAGKAEIWFYPEHPACRFRAYYVDLDQDGVVDEQVSLTHGVCDHLLELHRRYKSCWPSVLQGNPAEFVRALKSQGYFTAPLEPYLQSVISLYNEFGRLPFDTTNLPVLSEKQKERLLALVQLTARDMVE